MPAAALMALLCLLMAPAQALSGDALATMRGLRAQGCGGRAGIGAPLQVSAQLNSAVLRWAHGSPLHKAIADSGYREDRSTALHASGSADGVRSAIASRLCATLLDASAGDIGLLQRGQELWVVLAVPFAAPGPGVAPAVAGEVLGLVNDARRHARSCGGRHYEPAAALRLSDQLERAARAHAEEMLRGNYFEHEGLDGSTPAQRVAATGYRYRVVGENIALGPESAREVVRGWLASAGHCQNIMDPAFTEIGIAYSVNREGTPRIYWVQDFAQPR